MSHVSFIIPTLNAEKYIKKFYEHYKSLDLNFNHFFCFIDASTDNTKKEIKKYFKDKAVILDEITNTYKGSSRCSASRQGFIYMYQNYGSDYFIDLDIDLATDMNDIKIVFNKNIDFDLLIFSKFHKNSVVKNRSLNRRFISYMYTKVCKIIFRDQRITDYSSGFRIYSKKSMKFLINEIPERFTSPIQHLFILLFIRDKKINIVDHSCNYIDTNDNSAIKLKDLFTYLREFVNCILYFTFRKN